MTYVLRYEGKKRKDVMFESKAQAEKKLDELMSSGLYHPMDFFVFKKKK